MFEKTKQKAETLINDRVTQPIKMGIIISCAAFVIAGIALMVAVKNANR